MRGLLFMRRAGPSSSALLRSAQSSTALAYGLGRNDLDQDAAIYDPATAGFGYHDAECGIEDLIPLVHGESGT
jgi:hypothetical protein